MNRWNPNKQKSGIARLRRWTIAGGGGTIAKGESETSPLLTDLNFHFSLSDLTDDTGNVTNLTNNNAVTFAAGKLGNAAQFAAASSQYLSHASTATLQTGNTDFAIAAWFFITTGTTGDHAIISKDGGAREYLIYYSQGSGGVIGMYFWNDDATYELNLATGAVTQNAWHLLIVQNDKTNNLLRYRLDNGTEQTWARAKAQVATTDVLAIGAYYGGGGWYWNGALDSVAYWKGRCLTVDEQTALWNGGAGSQYPFDFAPADHIDILKPQAYQVHQRDGSNEGTINISGEYFGSPSTMEARFNGGAWETIASGLSNNVGRFSGSLTGQAAGQGTLSVRFGNNPAVVASTNYVGVGDVIVVAGQSNAVGRASNAQTYSHATLKAGIVDVYNTAGAWAELIEVTSYGSVRPGILTSYLANQSVPVGFIVIAEGGTSITAWQSGQTYYTRMATYISNAANNLVKFVFWWQGETDAVASMNQATYNANLDAMANQINTTYGVKTMACKLQTFSAASQAQQDAINAAIAEAWSDNANVLTGPDLTALTSDDAYHLLGDAKIASAATSWWNAIKAAFSW